MFCDLSDIYLRQPKTDVEEGSGHLPNMQYSYASMQGWRKGMEDSIICIPQFSAQSHLFGVLDGHGGAEVSAVVARTFPAFLRASKEFQAGNYERALKDTFKAMDKWLITPEGIKQLVEERYKSTWDELIKEMSDHKLKMKKTKKKTPLQETLAEYELFGDAYPPDEVLNLLGQQIVEESGTTANIVLVADRIYCANIGDSRSVAIARNKPLVLSFDHKPEDRIERKRIQQAGGFVMDGRVCGSLSLSRAFGDYQYKGKKPNEYMVSFEPDVTIHDLDQFNMLLIACDGIWEGQRDDYGESITAETWRKLQKSNNGVQVLRDLMNRILAKTLTDQTLFGLDNMSCVLVTFNENEEVKAVVKNGKQLRKKIRKIGKTRK